MSTNHYAKIFREETYATIHLGLTGSGVVILSGVLFDSWADMKKFLTRNVEFGLLIEDEYGVQRSAEEFSRIIESYSEERRGSQFRAIPVNGWMDSEGFSFYGEDFS